MQNQLRVHIAGRMEEITGSAPRVTALVQSDLSPSTTRLVRDLAKSAGEGHSEVINDYLRTLARHEALFEASAAMGKALFTGDLRPRDRELIILRVAWLCGAPYAWGEHVRIAKSFGLTSEEIEPVIEGSASSKLSERDCALLRGVEEIVSGTMISDATWNRMSEILSEVEQIEFVALVGQYMATAIIQNTLKVALPKHNNGLYAR